MATEKHTEPSKQRANLSVVRQTPLQSLVDAAESAVDGYRWCEVLFDQIKDNLDSGLFVHPNKTSQAKVEGGDNLRSVAIRCRDFAALGAYIAATFGNDIDVAREDAGAQS